MNRQEFEELELQVQQSNLPLKSYLQQIGVSYITTGAYSGGYPFSISGDIRSLR